MKRFKEVSQESVDRARAATLKAINKHLQILDKAIKEVEKSKTLEEFMQAKRKLLLATGPASFLQGDTCPHCLENLGAGGCDRCEYGAEWGKCSTRGSLWNATALASRLTGRLLGCYALSPQSEGAKGNIEEAWRTLKILRTSLQVLRARLGLCKKGRSVLLPVALAASVGCLILGSKGLEALTGLNVVAGSFVVTLLLVLYGVPVMLYEDL